MRKIGLVALCVVLLTSVSANLYFLISRDDRNGLLLPEHQRWAARAVAIKAAQEQVPIASVERLLDVSVIDLPGEVCVGLTPGYGVVGGSDVICFMTDTGRVSRQHSIGE